MRGILSSTPSLGSIRLLLGSKLLLLVQAWLVVRFERMAHGMLLVLVAVIALVGTLSLVFAIIGEPEEAAEDHRRPWRHKGGRAHP